MAVIQDTNKLEITANGQTDVFDLCQRRYKVFVNYVSSASGTLTFQMGDKEDELLSVPTPDGAGSYEATTTADKVFEIAGGGVFGVSAASVSGTIKVSITEIIS